MTARCRRSAAGPVRTRKVADDPLLKAWAQADLAASWTSNENAGRLRLEAADPTVQRIADSRDPQGRTVRGEEIYQYIYVMSRGELAKLGIFLQSKWNRCRQLTATRTCRGRSWGWCRSRRGARMPRSGGCQGNGKVT